MNKNTSAELCHKKLYVSIIGRPNSGKSFLVNTMMNRKISSVSNKPHTTSRVIRGIYTFENTQILFLDTPGITYNKGSTRNNEIAKVNINDNNFNVFIFPANKFLEDRMINLSRFVSNKMALITKIDMVKKPQLLPMTSRLHELGFQDIMYFSVKDSQCVEDFRKFLLRKAQWGEWDYPDNIHTDNTISMQLIEATKEVLFNKLYKELPYEIIIKNGDIKINEKGEYIVYQSLEIKRNAHHIILARIKEISMDAAKNMQSYLHTSKRVHLYLFVVEVNK